MRPAPLHGAGRALTQTPRFAILNQMPAASGIPLQVTDLEIWY